MYALALYPEEPRCLVSIGMNGISFNVGYGMRFETLEEIDSFKRKWKNHFFDLNKLKIIPAPKNPAQVS